MNAETFYAYYSQHPVTQLRYIDGDVNIIKNSHAVFTCILNSGMYCTTSWTMVITQLFFMLFNQQSCINKKIFLNYLFIYSSSVPKIIQLWPSRRTSPSVLFCQLQIQRGIDLVGRNNECTLFSYKTWPNVNWKCNNNNQIK